LASLLKTESLKSSSKTIIKYADSIFNTSQTLSNQMNTVLDWAQSNKDNIKAKPVEINVEVLLEDAISLVRESALLKDIRLSNQYDYETNVFVDTRMISIVFRNLLNNAIKYTKRGGTVISMIQEFESCIGISIIDTGIGIEKEKQDLVFVDKGSLLSSKGTEQEEGTGLGLHLSKIFVEKNLGTISFLSEYGKGSVFTVTLPKGNNKAVKRNINIDVTEIKDSQITTSNNETILIIDDNEEIIEILQSQFSGNYNCIKAINGNEGLQLAQNLLPDIIICDINLPGIQGIEICRILKEGELTNHIPVILITAMKEIEVINSAKNSGADALIHKPFDLEEIKLKVESLLHRSYPQYKVLSTENFDDKVNYPIDYNSKIINKVTDYIIKNISKSEMDTNIISQEVGVSRTQLWRIFKKSVGKTLGIMCMKLK